MRWKVAAIAVLLQASVPGGALAQQAASSSPGEAEAVESQPPGTSESDAEPSSPGAEPSARDLFLSGQRAYDNGEYDQALRLWTQAYALEPREGMKWNLAQVYERLGRLEEAVSALQDFVATAPAQSPYLDRARRRLASLERRVAATALQIETDVVGEVYVDGSLAGTLPLAEALAVSPGSHRVRIEAPGFEPFTTTFTVVVGETSTMTPELIAEREASFPTGWVVAGSGVAVAAVGLTLALVANGQQSSLEERCPGHVCPPEVDFDQVQADADSGRTLALAGDIVMGVGAAAAITGLVLVLLPNDDEGSDDATAWTPGLSCTSDGCLGSLRGQF